MMTPATFIAVAAEGGPHISIAPETLFHIGPFPITNSQLLGLIGGGLLLWILWSVAIAVRNGDAQRSRFVTGVMWLFESLYDTAVEVIGDKKVVAKVLPLAVTLMLFFLINNWLGLLPVVGPITYGVDAIPIFRGVAADLNTTFALAIISVVTAQIWAIRKLGFFGNVKRYLHNPFKDPLHFFIGLLEIIAEFSRTAALSLRMFGNVFGGEVLLVVIAFLTSSAAVVALPVFYMLELFVGAVQAYVFFMLTIVFISLGIPSKDESSYDSNSGTSGKTNGEEHIRATNSHSASEAA